MKNMLLKAIAFGAILIPPLCAGEAEQTVKAQAEQNARAMVEKDYYKMVSFLYPEVINRMGGQSQAVAALKKATDDLAAQGTEIDDVRIGTPSRIVEDGGIDFAIVPTESCLKNTTQGKFKTSSYLIGICPSGQYDLWTFIDGGKLSKEDVQKAFPKLAAKVDVPAVKTEVTD